MNTRKNSQEEYEMVGLYERIKEITARNNVSGIELGEKLGLKKAPLTDWKNQKSKPTLEQLIKICEIFALPADWLIFGKEAAESAPEEQHIIDIYRQDDERGKRRILTNAELELQETKIIRFWDWIETNLTKR